MAQIHANAHVPIVCVGGWVGGCEEKTFGLLVVEPIQVHEEEEQGGLLEVVIQFGGLMGGKAASSFSPLTFVMGIVCFEEEEEVVVVWCILSWKSKECPGRHCLALLDM